MKFTLEIPFDLAIKLKNSGLDPLEILENRVQNIGTMPTKPDTPEHTEFLAKLLSHGPVTASVVLQHAKREGVSRRALDAAKNAMGVRTVKHGFQGAWVWSLPDDSPHSRITSKKRAASILLELYGGYDTIELLEVYQGTEARGVTKDAVDAAIEFLNWSTRAEGGTIYLQTHNLC